MAISVQNVTTHGLQDLSGSSASSFAVTKRLVSDDALDLTDATDLAAIKAAAFGDPLDALVSLTDSNPVGRGLANSSFGLGLNPRVRSTWTPVR